jgi:hypothetical protein
MAMTTQQRSVVVGVFNDRQHADAAIHELRQAGFREDQVGVARRRPEGEGTDATTTTGEEGAHTGTGAAIGAVAGAGVGGLVASASSRGSSPPSDRSSRAVPWPPSWPMRPAERRSAA